jgi:hypothetical protein
MYYKGHGSEVKVHIVFLFCYKQMLNQVIYTRILTILFL